MARVESFEDLNVWKESGKLNQEIYTHIISNTTFRDFPLQDQINRSAGSIADNIAKGFNRENFDSSGRIWNIESRI